MEGRDPPDASADKEAPGGASSDGGPKGGGREERDKDELSTQLHGSPERKQGSRRRRAPTPLERETNQRREHKRRAFVGNVFAGLRAHSRYNLAKVAQKTFGFVQIAACDMLVQFSFIYIWCVGKGWERLL